MAIVNLISDLSKINENFKNPNRFDSNKDNILDNRYKGKALLEIPIKDDKFKVMTYELKTKLKEEKSSPNNRSWSIPNLNSTSPNYTPASTYIDSTKTFYGGNINPYSKGTPLDTIGKESRWKDFDYPSIELNKKPYSFGLPIQSIIFENKLNLDFSLPFNRYITNVNTPLSKIDIDSKWKDFSFEKRTGLPYNIPNIRTDLVKSKIFNILKWSNSTNPNRFGYSEIIFDKEYPILDIDKKYSGTFFDYELRDKLIKAYQSWNVPNPTNSNGFYTPISNYINSEQPFYGGNINPYSKGTPLDTIIFISKLDSKIAIYPNKIPYTIPSPLKGTWTGVDFSLPFESIYSKRQPPYSKGTPLVSIGKVSQFDKDKNNYLDKYFNNPSNEFDFRVLLNTEYGSWKIPNLKGAFYTLKSPYVESKNPFYSYENKYSKTYFITGSTKYNLMTSALKKEKNSILNYVLNYGLDKNKNYVKDIQNIYFKDVEELLNIHTLTDSNVLSLITRSNIRFGNLKDLWNASTTEVIEFLTLGTRTVTHLGKTIPKGKNYIEVGQANDNDTIYLGSGYYNRVENKNDSLSIHNEGPNKSAAWKGIFSAVQPFIYFKPPQGGKFSFFDSGLNPSYIAHSGISSILDVFIIEEGRRGGTVANLRNNLGVRASDAILSTSHFLTDIARKQSVKPELPVKLYSGKIKNTLDKKRGGIAAAANFGIPGMPTLKKSEEFNDVTNNPLDTDMITFAIVYFDKDLKYNKYIQFKAYLTQFNETISPEWNSGKYIGHPNNYYTYKGVSRSCQISFTIYSHNAWQREDNWKKINKLASLCYPQYNNNRMQGPILRLHLGSLYKNMPGFIGSLAFDVATNVPWETNDREVPHGINVNMNYTIIGHVLPELDKNMHFDVFKTKRFTNKGEFKSLEFSKSTNADPIQAAKEDYENLKIIAEQEKERKFGRKFGDSVEYTTFDANDDYSGLFEIAERLNRKSNDLLSITEETLGNAIPF